MADGIITRQQYTHDYVDGLRARVKEAEARAERAEAQLPAMRKALGLIPEATPEQVAYHVECMASDVPRLNAEKVAQWERAERAEADARTEAGYVNLLADAIDPMIRAIGFVADSASVAEYARAVREGTDRIAALTSERDEARRALAECERERDAYRDGRYAGPWQPVADHHNGEGYSRAGAAFVGLRRDGRYEWNCAGFKSALVETAAEAKAAADAHLIAAGWFLAGGPHGAGEAK